MGTKPGAAHAVWAGVGGADVLEHLVAALPLAGVRSGWRDEVLSHLTQLRDVLICERAERSTADGSAVLRERSQLLSELSLQRLQVMGSSDVDRLAYDLRRLVSQVRAHLRQGQ